MTSPQTAAQPRYRPLPFGVTRARVDRQPDGSMYLQAEQPLQAYGKRMSDYLLHWAEETPDATFLAQRQRLADGSLGDWQHLSYAQALTAARSIGQALLDRNLHAERPVLILSDNSLPHALLALACLWVGVPYCPTSPAYSLISKDFGKLRHVIRTLSPGLIWAEDGARYGAALAATAPADAHIVLSEGFDALALEGRQLTAFSQLLQTHATPAVDAAQAATNADTIAKFLFTSGSTKEPKAVINTHRMWCANQQQMRQSMPILQTERPVLVDWLPWNHTFGGNHNFGMVLTNGGTLYIDEGKPTPALIDRTLRNLREVAPTLYFNVPTGFDAIAQAMQSDLQLRSTFLSRVKMFFYAGASLAQPVWDSLYHSEEAEIGERIVMTSGLGMTESGPFGLFVTSPNVKAGDLGLPTPGLQLKLVPQDDKLEIRYRGANITDGYWRDAESTAEAFDAEGFFCTGDAVTWINPADPHQGLRFDGRIAEDFKLATGTFVSVGPLRGQIIASGAPYIQDAVITGLNRTEVGALIFPTQALRKLTVLAADAPWAEVLQQPGVVVFFEQLLEQWQRQATGSANRITRLMLMQEPPSIDLGEVTDKGSINQRAVLRHRDALVQDLYEKTPKNRVIQAQPATI